MCAPSLARLHKLSIPVTESGCWLWTANTGRDGYGKIKVNKHTVRAHRFSWEVHCGPIPNGLQVLHRCDVPCCVNPDHLFLGTNIDNVSDCVKKDRHARGNRNGSAILTDDDITAIRKIGRTVPQRVIAKQFGVNRGHISKILSMKLWKEIA